MSMAKLNRVRTRLLLALLLPVVGLFFLAAEEIVDSGQTAAQMIDVQRRVAFGVVLGNVIHELQKERGVSAGFLGSDGRSFGPELAKQRTLSDEKTELIALTVKGFDRELLTPSSKIHLARAQESLVQLDAVRRRVSNKRIGDREMIGIYSAAIANLLTTVTELASSKHDAAHPTSSRAYLELVRAKEWAGQERAIGSVGFGGGRFPPALYQRFVILAALQQETLRHFHEHASPAHRALVANVVAGPAVEEVERLRRIALSSIDTGTTGGVTGSHWFGTMTVKINLMKTVEDRLQPISLPRPELSGPRPTANFWLFHC